jgi:hypothetical protein
MAARFKDFDAAEAERKGDEPITFRLGGRQWTASHVNAGTFLAFIRGISGDTDKVVLAFDEYIRNVLDDHDREAFADMLLHSDVQISTLRDVVWWVVEQATGNPTPAAQPSPKRRSKPGRPLRVYSLDPVSTPEDSASAAG